MDPEQRALIHVKEGNILDVSFLENVFEEQIKEGTPIDGIIHFAAKKNATESVE